MNSVSTAHLEINAIDPLAGDAWDREVERHPLANIFHQSSWAKVLQETYGHDPAYLKVSSRSETVALIPFMNLSGWPKGKRGVSLPFSDECPPLLFSPDEAEAVQEAIVKYSQLREWSYVELRGEISTEKHEESEPTFHGHELSLKESEEEQERLLSNSARRSVRKSRQGGLTSRISQSWTDVQKFFGLHELTRRRHGLPPQSIDFFRSIHRFVLETGKGFVSLVEKEGVPAAGAVFFHSHSKGLYKFGASDERFLVDRPNHLAVWEGIRELISKGCSVLEFGRTSPSQTGLRRFKKSWGSKETNISYLRFHPNHGLNGQWQIKPASPVTSNLSGFRFIPLPINRLAGRMLYRHID